jgi:hypothetical protein
MENIDIKNNATMLNKEQNATSENMDTLEAHELG